MERTPSLFDSIVEVFLHDSIAWTSSVSRTSFGTCNDRRHHSCTACVYNISISVQSL